jgi:hypothetical protein
MNSRSTLLGLVVLGLVAMGVFLARLRPPSPPAEHVPAASAGQASEDDALPDATLADAVADAGGVRITLSLTPRPPVAFGKIGVRVRAEAGGSAVALEGGRISFEMTMPMGDHRYSLVPGDQGWQAAEVVLPLCGSGERRWYATVEGTAAGRPRAARFRLDLTPPGQAPTP